MATIPSKREKAFRNNMDALKMRYTGRFLGDEAAWKQRVRAYWRDLRNFPAEALTVAFNRAPTPDYYPDRFPGSGQLARIARDAKRQTEATSATEPDPESDKGKLARWGGDMGELRMMFPDILFAEANDLPAGSPFTASAIEWAQEDRTRTKGRLGNTPREIGRARFGLLWQMMEEHTEPSMRR